jgi:hypothetical protein
MRVQNLTCLLRAELLYYLVTTMYLYVLSLVFLLMYIAYVPPGTYVVY